MIEISTIIFCFLFSLKSFVRNYKCYYFLLGIFTFAWCKFTQGLSYPGSDLLLNPQAIVLRKGPNNALRKAYSIRISSLHYYKIFPTLPSPFSSSFLILLLLLLSSSSLSPSLCTTT